MAAFAPLQVNAASKAYFDGLDYERDFTNRHDIYGEDAFSLVGGITEYSFDVMCFNIINLVIVKQQKIKPQIAYNNWPVTKSKLSQIGNRRQRL